MKQKTSMRSCIVKKTQERGEKNFSEKMNKFDFPKLDIKELQYIEGPLIKTEVLNFL